MIEPLSPDRVKVETLALPDGRVVREIASTWRDEREVILRLVLDPNEPPPAGWLPPEE